MDEWVRRLLAWIWSVTTHTYTLAGTILGSTVVAVLPWIMSHLLSASASDKLALALILSIHTYHLLGFAILSIGLLFASFLAWNEERDLVEVSLKSQHSAERKLLENAQPQFVAEITEVSIDGDHQQPDWIKLYVYMTIRNQGAESAIDRWTLRVVPPHPGTPFIQTVKGLSETQEGRGGKMGGNLSHDVDVIGRGGRKEGWLLCHGPKSRLGLTTGQRPAVMVSFKDVHDSEYSVIDPPGFKHELFDLRDLRQ